MLKERKKTHFIDKSHVYALIFDARVNSTCSDGLELERITNKCELKNKAAKI